MFGGLFGGGSPKYDTNMSQPFMDALRGYASTLGGDYQHSRDQGVGINSKYMDALNGFSKYLSTNPATSSYNATQVANATHGNAQAAERAKASTLSDLAARGISGDSGLAAGAIGNINEATAGRTADAQNIVGQNNIDRYASNLSQLANLWSGANNTSFNQTNALGNEYGNENQQLFGNADHLAQEKYQSDLNNQNAQDAFLSTIGGALTSAFAPGAGAAGAAAKVANPAVKVAGDVNGDNGVMGNQDMTNLFNKKWSVYTPG